MSGKAYTPIYYADYLKLSQLLSAQSPRSVETGKPAHDETLFIIVHQAYELWFKQILHELDSVMAMFRTHTVDERNMGVAVSRFDRITQIQKLLIEQLSVLETMTPLDFLDFRDLLVPASGFQSAQFRQIENKMGLKPSQRVLFDSRSYSSLLSTHDQQAIQKSEIEPSLFDLIQSWLERTPFLKFKDFDFLKMYRDSVEQMLTRDEEIIRSNPVLSEDGKAKQLTFLNLTRQNFSALFDKTQYDELKQKGDRRLSFEAIQAAVLIFLYRDQPILHLPYRLLSLLVEMDENWTSWRHRHALMVQRMIGMKIGTGGSSGSNYLRQTAERHQIYLDLFHLSTFLIPRSQIPKLPPEVVRNLGFYYQGSA